MKQKILILGIIFLVFSKVSAQTPSNVLFGERNLSNISADISTKISLYFDKEGSIYPSYFISNTSLNNSGASLTKWYANNPTQFLEISKNYNCSFSKYSLENCIILNDSISSLYIKQINQKKTDFNAGFQSLTFLIHGFRKPFVTTNGDASSPMDYKTMQETINLYKYGTTKTFFVEIYWDGWYGKRFSANLKANSVMYKFFEKSQINAELMGAGLKTIIPNLKFDTINIITHSLGAKVALFALLDMKKDNIKTPSNKKINLVFVAPAISGELIADNFHKRNSKIDYKTSDNYHLLIIYNENDIALRKKVGFLGPGPYKHGNTTLGCNYDNAASKLKTTFQTKFPNSKLDLYDCSSVGGCHLVSCYFSSKKLQEALKNL